MATGNDWIAGYMEVALNGKILASEGSFSITHGHFKTTKLFGPDGRPAGARSEWVTPKVSGNVRKNKSLRIVNDLLNMDGATVTIKSADNTTHLFENAGFSGDGVYDTDTGNIAFESEADSSTEIPG